MQAIRRDLGHGDEADSMHARMNLGDTRAVLRERFARENNVLGQIGRKGVAVDVGVGYAVTLAPGTFIGVTRVTMQRILVEVSMGTGTA